LVALIGGFVIYRLVNRFMPIRLSEEEEFNGADVSIHQIGATNDNNQ